MEVNYEVDIVRLPDNVQIGDTVNIVDGMGELYISARILKLSVDVYKRQVYESRPMTDVGYPFADFEDFGTNYMGTKSGALPNVSVVINIWDTEDNRKNVSNLCGILFQEAMIMSEAYGFRVALKIDESSTQITQDRTCLLYTST